MFVSPEYSLGSLAQFIKSEAIGSKAIIFMPTKDSFAGLEGFFKDPNSRQFYTISPEEHQRIVECNHLREYFGNSLANHSYTPEDVIGVAFGTTHEGEGVQLRQIYFTQRGLK